MTTDKSTPATPEEPYTKSLAPRVSDLYLTVFRPLPLEPAPILASDGFVDVHPTYRGVVTFEVLKKREVKP